MIIDIPFIITTFKINSNQNVLAVIEYHFGAYVKEDNYFSDKKIINIEIIETQKDLYKLIVNNCRIDKAYDLSSLVGLLHEILIDKDNFVTDRFFYLHACLFEKNDNWIAIMGPSGNGKSTIAYGMLENGFTYYTDDLIYISTGDGGLGAYNKPVYLRNIDCIERYRWNKNINELKKRQICYEDGTKRFCFRPSYSDEKKEKIGKIKTDKLNIYSIRRELVNSDFSIRKLNSFSEIMETIIVNTYKSIYWKTLKRQTASRIMKYTP